MTPADEHQQSFRLLREASDAILAGVAREMPGWVERSVARVLDAWGRTPPDARVDAERAAVGAGRAASERIVDELRDLFARDVEQQSRTPLEIVRSAYREPTAVLAAVGVAPVVRDEFDERAWPDDRYGLVVHDLGDLGDAELAPLQMVWGLAKAKLLRARYG
jgi:hypothetical protein